MSSSASAASAPAAAPAAAAAASPAPAPAVASFTPAASRSASSRSSTQWDRCLENGAIKTSYGAVVAGVASLLLFRKSGARFATMGFGAGIGAGMSWLECKQAYSPTRYHNALMSPAQNAAFVPKSPSEFSSVQDGLLPTFAIKDNKSK